MPRPTDETLAERATLEADGLRRCRSCEHVLPLDDFGFHKAKRRDHCKPCVNEQVRRYDTAAKERDPEGYRARQKAYNEKHRAQQDPAARSAQLRRYNLRRYGVTPEWFDDMLARQGGVCAICGRPESGGRRFHVDHNHETGAVRGILCTWCNPALGALGSIEVLRSAIAYLELHARGQGMPAEVAPGL